MSVDADASRLKRVQVRALVKRNSCAARIKDYHQLAEQASTDPTIASQLIAASREVDVVWSGFQSEDNAVLDALCDLGTPAEYSSESIIEMGRLVNYIRSIISDYEAHNKAALDETTYRGGTSNHSQDGGLQSQGPTARSDGIHSRLPEIPLPSFDGDIYKWPAFRDRFVALVDQRSHISDIEKFYYLIGCLKGDASDAIRGIPISGPTFQLAWNTLSARFDKPRLVAGALVENLLQVPVSTNESLVDLNKFMSVFGEGIAVLSSLNIPDMGDFILFSLASRCLPASIRTLFESQVTSEYPNVQELFAFVKSRVAVLERVQGATLATRAPISRVREKPKAIPDAPRRLFKPTQMALVSTAVTNPTLSCMCCDQSHKLEICRKFKSWSVDEREKWARSRRVCYLCLNDGHWSNRCRSKVVCALCSRRHHTLLHPEQTQSNVVKVPVQRDSEHSPPASLLSGHGHPSVILGTALVHVRDRSGSYQEARALLDSASQISAITVECAERLGLRWSRYTTPITGLSGVPVVDVQGCVDCRVLPRFATDPMLSFNAWVLPSITGELPRCSLNPAIKEKYAHLALADPKFHVSAPVDLLLGADLFATVMDGRQIVVDQSLPTAFSTCFGWVLIGSASLPEAILPSFSATSLLVSVEQLIDRFWHVEEPDSAPLQFTDNGKCESIFLEQTVRDASGRFSVPLPFRPSVACNNVFAGSLAVAEKRFMRLERKFSSDEPLRLKYTEFMTEYLALGHMSVTSSPGRYIIPHHAVFNSSSKIRVVFDASAKCSDGMSLNSVLFAGPKLQQDIIDVLTRFRLFRHVFTSDIRQMYRQIMVLPAYRPYQHILWRSSPHDKLVEYELNTVTYGVNCAPFLALRVLQTIAEDECGNFPRVRDALRNQTYVDDVCYGADSADGAVIVQGELIDVLSRAGLELRKWASNTPAVLNSVPEEFRVINPVSFSSDEGADTKVLGLHWHPVNDVLSCGLRIDTKNVCTKRGILSLTARFFDPLGLFAPAIFLAKHIMQRTWQANCAWDDPVPSDIERDWLQFVSELPQLSSVQIPRYFNTTSGTTCSLFGFCDASQRGYAAVVYLCVHDVPRESSISLIGCKTKLAPIKSLTIPRLELNAAVLLSRWMHRIRSILCDHVTIADTYAWTDSQVVLSWLTVSHESFKQYVSNRVHQVQSLLPDCLWRHVASEENPADCASRGLMPSALPRYDLYWRGPHFLLKEPHEWGSDVSRLPQADLPEMKSFPLAVCVTQPVSEWFDCFSSFDHMLRVVSRVMYFGLKCRRQITVLTTTLTRDNLDRALLIVVAASQRNSFAILRCQLENKSRITSKSLARLCPFIDSDGIIRVGGRLRFSMLPYDSRHPILLAKDSYLSILICRHWHKVTCHSGPRVMTAMINRQFWIVSLRSVLRTVMSQCTRCVRLRAVNPQPRMADLPSARVQQSRAFNRVGIDYAGPLQMRELKLRKSRTYKVYVAIFICLSVKAVHLEVVSELSTAAFLAAFDRFVARRGLPSDVYSDCGTNFVGAAKQLRQLVNNAESQSCISAVRSSCNWHFNPPSAPHFGGLWEAAVRSTKRLLCRIMGPHTFSYEEFTTLVCRVEAVLNSRPLTPASTDPHDLESLTPGHFLINQPLLAVPPRTPENSARSITNCWKLLDQCHQAFWRRWSTEYLNTLQERTKWSVDQPNVKLDDMVVIKTNLAPPLEWRMGRVAEVLPGPDGVVRVVRLKTARGELVRPIAKVVVLPMQ